MPSLTDFSLAGAVFVLVLATHVGWWRIRRPRREMAHLVAIFLVFPLAFLLALYLLLPASTLPGLLYRGLLLSSLSLIYIMTYPPIQAGCPSLRIVLAVKQAGEPGLSFAEILALFPPESLFFDRFDDLVGEGLISWQYDSWGISATGRWIARFFLALRRALGLPLGEG